MSSLPLCVLSLSLFATLQSGAELPLPDLMEQGSHQRVLDLLLEGADVDEKQSDGSTALIWAAYHADADTLARLLIKGADPNVQNRFGLRAISIVCRNGDLRSFEHLRTAGANLGVKFRGGESALFSAVRSGNSDLVARLIELGECPNAVIGGGQTPLMWAASAGHLKVADLLLEAGADADARTKSGFAPIHYAARAGHTSIVKRLLESGVDANMPIEWKGGRGYRFPMNQSSALILAIENAEYETAVALLEGGSDPNDKRTGYAPLHTMTWVRKAHTGDSSDPEPINYSRITSMKFIDHLIEFGADVDLQAKGGATPFFLAAQRSDAAMMRILMKYGADPFTPNGRGTTPLIVAAGVGRGAENDQAGTQEEAIEAVEFCLELGLDINAVDQSGDTAMHGAAYGQWPDMVYFLYENGADIEVWNQLNKSKWSPLLISQGYRKGNFKPSYDTIDAIEAVMAAVGVTLRYDPPDGGNTY